MAEGGDNGMQATGQAQIASVLYVTDKRSGEIVPLYYDPQLGGFPITISNVDIGVFLKLAGRSGGQTAYGGINASENLTLRGSSHATPGRVDLLHVLLSDAAATPATAGHWQRSGGILYFHDGTAARRTVLQSDAAPADTNILRYVAATGAWVAGSLSVNLASEVTGDLPLSNLAQGTARSVLGVTGNGAADYAPIQGTADQTLRVNAAGTALEFGTLAPKGGGTGLTGYTAGDMTYCSATDVLAKRAIGTAGNVLKVVSGVPDWAQLFAYESFSADDTADSTDGGKLWDVSASGGARTMALPAISGITNGFIIGFRKSDSSTNTVTIDPNGAETINGASSLVLRTQWDVVWLMKNGSEWTIVAESRAIAYVHVRDEKAASTDGGTATTGSWETRTLNTEVSDVYGIASLAANQVTLQPGTYNCKISAPSYLTGRNQAKLYNATDASDILLGTSEFQNDGATINRSFVEGRFQLTAAKALEVRHRVATTRATDGYGIAQAWGTNVYTVAEFWRVG